MTTSQIHSEVSLAELLHGVKRLDTVALERFADEVLAIRAQRRAPSLSQEESELLMKINQGLPREIRTRFAELNEKRLAEALTEEEHTELLQLIDHIEAHDVERVTNLGKLAQLRNVPVRALMKQLGIQRPAYA
ncbi:MAG: STAS/SEC14 domain-containing protein [Caldilineaceae bacterium]|jgi:hypothetical protein